MQPHAYTGCLTLPSLLSLTTVIPSWGTICEVVLQAREGRSPAGAAPRRSSSHRGGQHRRVQQRPGSECAILEISGQRWKELLYCQGRRDCPTLQAPAAPPPPAWRCLVFYYDFTFIYLHFYKLGFLRLFFQQLLFTLSLTSSARICVYRGGVVRVCLWTVLSIFLRKKHFKGLCL